MSFQRVLESILFFPQRDPSVKHWDDEYGHWDDGIVCKNDRLLCKRSNIYGELSQHSFAVFEKSKEINKLAEERDFLKIFN